MPKLSALVIASFLCVFPPGAWGKEGTGTGELVPIMAPVTVIGTFSNPASGRSTMDRTMIERLPAGKGSINELLTRFPDVQVGEGFRAAKNAGSIVPPPISISGGKSFSNNFLIDAIGNNSLLDPANLTVTQPNDVPGNAQELFLHPRLVEHLSVYDSNIPARFGGFTGGVVEVETRDPGPDFGGGVDYRTTRDAWTRFHLREGESRPEFEIHEFGADLSLPLRPGMGLLGSYRQLQSRIPRRHLDGSKTEFQRKEDIFLRYAWEMPAGPVRLTFASTPAEAELFYADVANSDLTIDWSATRVQADYIRPLPQGELQVAAGYRFSENSRQAPTDLRKWAITDSRPWGALNGSLTSKEGGFGDIRKKQESVAFRASHAIAPLRAGPLTHTPEWGIELETIRGTFDRRDTSHVYDGAKITPDVICGDDAYTCIDGEQFFTLRTIYPAQSVSARINLADLYLEDRLQWRLLTLRPGCRISYEDFMENLNVAPRLAGEYDLLGDRRTILIAGWNRYYGRALLTYKLREAQEPYSTQTRGTQGGNFLGEWQDSFQGNNATRFSRLRTPYADEWTAGVDQAFLKGRLTIKYVHREGKDEFAQDYGDRQADGLRYYTLTNGGRSRHQSWRAAWERTWPGHFLSLNATWRESSGNEENYSEVVSSEESEKRVWFEGRLIHASELPRRDFNRAWIVNLTYVGRLPGGFTFSNVTRYQSGYRALVQTRQEREVPPGEGRVDPATGEPVFEALRVYEEEDRPDGIVFDWKIFWRNPALPGFLVTLEIDNVFNSRIETGTDENDFEVGRQFWAGVEYKF